MKTILIQKSKPARLCVLILALFSLYFSADAQLKIDYGKSYVNLTKGTVGGTIEPGDTLQIRATFVVGGSGTNDYVDSCAYFDVIPANSVYIPSSLCVLTNEGKIYKTFTDAAGDDAGWISGSNVQINLGFKNAPIATAFRRGRVKFNDKPSFFGSTCIMIASYRVVVTGGYGSKVSVGAGTITYMPFGSTLTSITFNPDTVMVFKNYPICTNTSPNNAVINEFGGTFGSGKAKNRFASTKVSNNYTYAAFSSNMPNDYYYAISNNTSTGGLGYTTSNAWPIPDGSSPSHRVFGVWDIIGDHTGAVNPLLGNPATDTVAGSGGYMAVINSSYKTGIAFLDTVYNLCPNTYYQYYAWFRNICSKCACDSNGKSPGNTGYIPTAPGDSSGVYPNLTFNVNGYDYYTTGNIQYTGQWIRKSFVYLTGPTQTSMVIYIRNNAPGGGGNDWAIDDIGVASCAPSITLTPNKPDTLCQGADDTVRFKVTAFFNNYTEWKLEQSINGGITWTSPGNDTLGLAPTGSATPVFNPVSGLYEYIITRYYRLNHVDTIVTYRLTIASTVGNLANPNCAYIASQPKIIHSIDCNIVLTTAIVLKGWLNNQSAQLQWTSTNETANTRFVVQRSDGDQQHFRDITTIQGQGIKGSGNVYSFSDPEPVNGQSYYRINIADNDLHTISRTVLLSHSGFDFEVKSLVNPFRDMISFDLISPADQTAIYLIHDAYGRPVRREIQHVGTGLNSVRIYGLAQLPYGFYIIEIQCGDKKISKSMIKLNN
jgi:hypothetical protein